MSRVCQQDGCLESQWYEYFYCEAHVEQAQLANSLLWSVVR